MWYVRVDRGPRIRIRADFGTPELDEEYRAAIVGTPQQRKATPSTSSLQRLVARYRETTAWSNLSLATRKQRDNIFVGVLETAGHEPYSRITEGTIEAGKERRGHTPAQARNFLDAMRGLFRWAKHAGHRKDDPTASVRNPKRNAKNGFIPWTEDHVAQYQARWPIGTRQRVWLDVLLYTGLRRGDAVRLGRPHVRDGVATMKTEKSGFLVEVNLPILSVLQATLDAGPCGDLTFIAGANGRPLTKESFGNEFKAACKAACKAARVPGSAHGVRKIAATTAADNGASEYALMAIFGWTDPKMASHYVKTANRKRLAANSMNTLNAGRTSIPAPDRQVRAKGGKQQ